jgi:hypothetical protein
MSPLSYTDGIVTETFLATWSVMRNGSRHEVPRTLTALSPSSSVYETALEALDRSLKLSPSSALAFGFSSIIRAWIGEDTTAVEHARVGIRLSPYDRLIYLPYVGLAYAYFFMGKYIEVRAPQAGPRQRAPVSAFHAICTQRR